MLNPETINVGDILTCTETGKAFEAKRSGISFNYARDDQGYVYSDEGADIRERRNLLDRSKPFWCYLDLQGGWNVTGWKGNVLGRVHQKTASKSGWRGSTIYRFHVRDVHGQWWSGRGAGAGMICTLRPMKKPDYAKTWGNAA